jgi:hypothetical protein
VITGYWLTSKILIKLFQTVDAYYDVRDRGGLLASLCALALAIVAHTNSFRLTYQVVYHDAFQEPSFWNGAFDYPQTSDVMLDQ